MAQGTSRWRSLTALASLLLVLTACGTSTAPEGNGAAQNDAAANGVVENNAAVEPTLAPAGQDAGCQEAPAPPTDVPTFEPTDPPEPSAAGTLTGMISTNCGDVEVELFADKAPTTVASFEFLGAEGYWENSPCHRVTTQGIFVLQCGDPTGTGRGGPGYTFGIENAPEDGSYPRGTLAMARSSQDPNSNSGQFFIVYQDTSLPVEGGGYSIFGKVTSGMDIVDRVAEQGVDGGGADGPPAAPISILSVEATQEKATE